MAGRLHHHALAVPLELAAQRAGPQVEGLHGRGDVAGLVDQEADLSQVQPVRVLAQPVVQLHLPLGATGVPHLAPIGVEHGQPEIRGAFSARVGNRMPAPLRHCAQRHLLVVERRESLQAGEVGGERELAIAHRERGAAVEDTQHRVVSLDHAAPADCGPGGLRAQGRGRRAEKLTPGESHWPALAIEYRFMCKSGRGVGSMASQSNSTHGSCLRSGQLEWRKGPFDSDFDPGSCSRGLSGNG